MDPEKGSPCAGCVERWLKQRLVWAERAELSELKLRRELIAELLGENSPHVFYEIMNDGTATRLEGAVYPHPECECAKENYIAPENWTKKTNFAFSPIYQLRCSRFGTPDGNLWLSAALGDAPLSREKIRAFGVATDREASRFKAVEEWMKRAAIADLKLRDSAAGERLQTGEAQLLARDQIELLSSDGLGSGATRDEACLEALHTLAKTRTLARYAVSMKNPMLIVGANNWLRTKVPFFLLQQYDLHLLFYPNSTPSWVVGVAAFSRQQSDVKPIFVFGSAHEIGRALDNALHKVLEVCRPAEFDEEDGPSRGAEGSSKLNMWWTHWIYRCPKISLKDVLHLEPYPKDLALWRDYFRDGQPPLTIVGLNHPCLPSAIKHLVKIHMPAEAAPASRNVRGIGTLASFRDALA